MDDWMTMQDLAEMYRVSERTIRRWIANGELPADRLPGGRLIRIDVANLQKLTQPVSCKPVTTSQSPQPGSKTEVVERVRRELGLKFMQLNISSPIRSLGHEKVIEQRILLVDLGSTND